MKQRVITAVVALAIFIPILIAGGGWIDTAGAVLALIALSEVYIMRKRIILSPDFLIASLGILAVVLPNSFFRWLPAFLGRIDLIYIAVALLLCITVTTKNRTTFDDIGVSVLSFFYIGTGFHYLISVRNDAGLDTLMFALLIVWLTDTGAYMIGRKLGRHKLWPAISPNKTIEGSVGGVVLALITAAIYLMFFPQYYTFWPMMGIALCLSVIGQIGDLIESALKRFYGVKDSGKILPGHGGILDRFESLLLVLTLLHLFGIV